MLNESDVKGELNQIIQNSGVNREIPEFGDMLKCIKNMGDAFDYENAVKEYKQSMEKLYNNYPVLTANAIEIANVFEKFAAKEGDYRSNLVQTANQEVFKNRGIATFKDADKVEKEIISQIEKLQEVASDSDAKKILGEKDAKEFKNKLDDLGLEIMDSGLTTAEKANLYKKGLSDLQSWCGEKAQDKKQAATPTKWQELKASIGFKLLAFGCVLAGQSKKAKEYNDLASKAIDGLKDKARDVSSKLDSIKEQIGNMKSNPDIMQESHVQKVQQQKKDKPIQR